MLYSARARVIAAFLLAFFVLVAGAGSVERSQSVPARRHCFVFTADSYQPHVFSPSQLPIAVRAGLARAPSPPARLNHQHPRAQRLQGRLGAQRYIRHERPGQRRALTAQLRQHPHLIRLFNLALRYDYTAAAMLLARREAAVERLLLRQLDLLRSRADERRRGTHDVVRNLVLRATADPAAGDMRVRLQRVLRGLECDRTAPQHVVGRTVYDMLGDGFGSRIPVLGDGVLLVA